MPIPPTTRLACWFCLLAGLVGGVPGIAHGQQAGILIVPFEDSTSTVHGRAGDLVRFSDTPGSSTSYDIEFEGVLYRNVWSARLIPFDSSFAPVYVYSVLNSADHLFRNTERERVYDRADLAARARQMFAYHPHRDHFAAFDCRSINQKEEHETEGKAGWPKTIACVEAYLREFPRGFHRAEFDWWAVRLRNSSYEYEGDPAGPMKEARVFETYLRSRPGHPLRREIEFRLATLWSLAYEMIETADDPPSETQKAEATGYRARADSMYARLATTADPALAAKAVIAQFNLRNGRRIYANPNAW
jgi:hypothetical protein